MTASRTRRSALDPLARQILDLIHRRNLRVGDPIPTELELIDELAVSRNSVREAIRALRALGIVDIRHGYGTFVGAAPLAALSPSLAFRAVADRSGDLTGLRDLVELREIVETGVVERLAGVLPAATLDGLDVLCDEMATTHLDPAVDRRFHQTLYERLDNRLVGQLVEAFWDAYESARAALTADTDADVAHTVAGHRAIVAALRAADGPAARDAMREHFADIRRRLGG